MSFKYVFIPKMSPVSAELYYWVITPDGLMWRQHSPAVAGQGGLSLNYLIYSSQVTITPLNISIMIFKHFRAMPSMRRGKRANQLHSSVNADASGGSAEVDELHNVEEAGVESKYGCYLQQ